MAVWKLTRLGAVSSATGEPFGPDVEIVTALFGEEEEQGEDRVRGAGFVRKDFLLAEATDEVLEGAFCTWRTRTPPAKSEPERRFDLGMAREFLERMLREGREDRSAVCLTLALLLARKRRLVILDQGADFLRARWPREKEDFVVPAPEVSEAEAEVLQQDLMRLFDLELGQPPPDPAASEQAEGAQDAAADAPATAPETSPPGEKDESEEGGIG